MVKYISLVFDCTLSRATTVTSSDVAWVIAVGAVYGFAFQPPSQSGLAHIFATSCVKDIRELYTREELDFARLSHHLSLLQSGSPFVEGCD